MNQLLNNNNILIYHDALISANYGQLDCFFGEGNGTPLQYSCLENPMDGGDQWAAVHGVTTERLHVHFSLSCIGEGKSYPLQYSCLENPRDGEAWWAAVYGVAQSQTRLKQLSSSSRLLLILHYYKNTTVNTLIHISQFRLLKFFFQEFFIFSKQN